MDNAAISETRKDAHARGRSRQASCNIGCLCVRCIDEWTMQGLAGDEVSSEIPADGRRGYPIAAACAAASQSRSVAVRPRTAAASRFRKQLQDVCKCEPIAASRPIDFR
jgi:hypothetical protein